MLSEKQLQDAKLCHGIKCSECSMKDEDNTGLYTERAAKTALAYRDMLKQLEWICVGESGEGEDVIICSDCQNEKKDSHKADCKLAEMLKEWT